MRCNAHLVISLNLVLIHAFTKDATVLDEVRSWWDRFQFTHPRKMRQQVCHVILNTVVSIHASTQDATPDCKSKVYEWMFQFTHPRKMRQEHPPPILDHRVSIHASTQDATIIEVASQAVHRFNSRIHARCDLIQSKLSDFKELSGGYR